MEAIVLAGGMGTRLKSVISNLPKPMAPIGDKPFLEYILEYLYRQGVKRVILSTGFKHEKIKEYFKNYYKHILLVYSVENEPLGTGGAIKKAFELVTDTKVFILNGDTFFDVRLSELASKHSSFQSDLTLALKPMREFERYGLVRTEGDKVVEFVEKKYQQFGTINGGLYLANSVLFNKFNLPEKFSFETDFMEKYHDKLNINAYISDTFFIDIGIPKDYIIAQRELINYI